MSFDRLRYELRLMDKKVLLTPFLVMLGFGAFAVFLHFLKFPPARFLSSGLEMILPIAAGVVAGTVAIQDPCLELQLTFPRKYHATGMQRLFLIIGWTVCVALLSSALIFLLNQQYLFHLSPDLSMGMRFVIAQLAWFATLLWCVAVCLCAALLTRSRSAGGALLAGIWVAEIFFKDILFSTTWLRPFFLFPTTLIYSTGVITQAAFQNWLINRAEVLGVALLLLPLGWFLLRNTEGLLKSSTEE